MKGMWKTYYKREATAAGIWGEVSKGKHVRIEFEAKWRAAIAVDLTHRISKKYKPHEYDQ